VPRKEPIRISRSTTFFLRKYVLFPNSGIEPINGTSWGSEATEKFNAMVFNETFQVEVMSDVLLVDKTKPIEVTLHGSVNGKHFIVNNQFVQWGYAKRKQT